MAGECDKDVEREEIKPSEETEKKTEEISDEYLLEDVTVQNPKKSNKIDPLAEMLNVSTTCYGFFLI